MYLQYSKESGGASCYHLERHDDYPLEIPIKCSLDCYHLNNDVPCQMLFGLDSSKMKDFV
jgi:hypothetical protein